MYVCTSRTMYIQDPTALSGWDDLDLHCLQSDFPSQFIFPLKFGSLSDSNGTMSYVFVACCHSNRGQYF